MSEVSQDAAMRTLRWVVIGAGGRMGRQLVACSREHVGLELVGALDRPGGELLGRDAGEVAGVGALGVKITSDATDALRLAQVAVDFSDANAVLDHARLCAARGIALLVGTTGLGDATTQQLRELSSRIPVLVAANTSLGVTLLAALVEAVARALPAQFDIEVVEAHHRHKKDAPSGTALALGAAAARGRERPLEEIRAAPRSGIAPRREGEIGFAVVRGGDIVGDHSVIFAGVGERLTLSHQATDRAVFARGALRAAEWLGRQPAGFYGMQDFLDLKQYLSG